MHLKFLLCLTLLLGACGNDDKRAERGAANGDASDALPRPAGASGSITGMPDHPGPGQAVADTAMDPELGEDGLPLLGEDGVPLPPEALDETTLPGDAALAAPEIAMPVDEPGAGDAVAVVRDYYGAINGGDFDRAHAMWSDGGRASGQTADQFARGFSDTESISVQVQSPGRIEGAAGSRYIEVPVAVEGRQRDGSVRRFVGAYTLRRAVVDGASEAQRQWHIAAADIREVRP
jgi:hypothetical protein